MAGGKGSPPGLLQAGDLRRMVALGQECLQQHVGIINALNVFPVPDGDTGTNMLLTLKAAVEELDGVQAPGLGAVAEALAFGALMGARGNSGVILSQFFQGVAHRWKGMEAAGGRELAEALAQATHYAYKAVSNPVEGTMLTVVKAAAQAAQEAVRKGETSPLQVWERACVAARSALAETPDLLPVLKEAGVVDAGGLGLVALLEGGRAHLTGQPVAPLDVAQGQAAPHASYLAATEQQEYGYCTQFLLQGAGLDVEAVRARMTSMADSAVVVGDTTMLKVHVHTPDPGPVLSYAVALGSLTQVKIDNIEQQHQDFLRLHRREKEMAPLGVVAVVSGPGLERVFRELGAAALVPGGQTMNPSTRDLVEHAAQAAAAEVVLLPNNPNIVGTARQAASLGPKPLHLVPTLSIPQGIAALLAFDPSADVATNVSQMQAAAAKVRSGEVTTAVRSTSVSGQRVSAGQAIGLLDGTIVAVTDTVAEAVKEVLRCASPQEEALVTLYWGGDTQEPDAQRLAVELRSVYPGMEVELVYGGQPHYHYLLSVE
ncbi:MAG: DAK2 domain-containing protein [Chloroflexi bacterium]|nr:DAK2 domain-containing protein [Chloroflexota bacterium]